MHKVISTIIEKIYFKYLKLNLDKTTRLCSCGWFVCVMCVSCMFLNRITFIINFWLFILFIYNNYIIFPISYSQRLKFNITLSICHNFNYGFLLSFKFKLNQFCICSFHFHYFCFVYCINNSRFINNKYFGRVS